MKCTMCLVLLAMSGFFSHAMASPQLLENEENQGKSKFTVLREMYDAGSKLTLDPAKDGIWTGRAYNVSSDNALGAGLVVLHGNEGPVFPSELQGLFVVIDKNSVTSFDTVDKSKEASIVQGIAADAKLATFKIGTTNGALSVTIQAKDLSGLKKSCSAFEGYSVVQSFKKSGDYILVHQRGILDLDQSQIRDDQKEACEKIRQAAIATEGIAYFFKHVKKS